MSVKEVCNSLTHDRLLRWVSALKQEVLRMRGEVAARGEDSLITDPVFQQEVITFISSHYEKLFLVNRALDGQVVFTGCTPIEEVPIV